MLKKILKYVLRKNNQKWNFKFSEMLKDFHILVDLYVLEDDENLTFDAINLKHEVFNGICELYNKIPKTNYISSEEALKDVVPFNWSKEVLSGEKKLL
jgi:hypothetical protein